MAYSYCKNGTNGYYYKGTPYLESKTDCRFYDEERVDCTALKCLYCGFERKDCGFYKRRNDDDDQ